MKKHWTGQTLVYSFFKEYEDEEQQIKSIRPEHRPNDPTVNDIKHIKYDEAGNVSYKIAHSDVEFTKLPCMCRVGDPNDIKYKQLYDKEMPVTFKKHKHMQELKRTIL